MGTFKIFPKKITRISLSSSFRISFAISPAVGPQLSGFMPAYSLLGTRGVASDGWFGVRGSRGARSGRRLGDW